MTTETRVTTQVHRVHIRATPQAIWDAITRPEWTERYGYGGRAEYDLRPGGAYRGLASDALVGGEMEDTGAGGGWSWVLSGLKTLLETGTPLSGG